MNKKLPAWLLIFLEYLGENLPHQKKKFQLCLPASGVGHSEPAGHVWQLPAPAVSLYVPMSQVSQDSSPSPLQIKKESQPRWIHSPDPGRCWHNFQVWFFFSSLASEGCHYYYWGIIFKPFMERRAWKPNMKLPSGECQRKPTNKKSIFI